MTLAIWIAELAVGLVAAWQLARIAARPAFRAATVWRPGWKWPLVGSALLLGGVILFAALRWPLFRHIGAAGLAGFLAAAWWRSRPDYGRFRRLPPGSLGFGHSLDALPNPRYYLEQAARFGPVFKSSEFWRPVVCVVGLGAVRSLLSSHGPSLGGARFTRRYHRFIPRGVLRYMDPGTHREFAPRFRAAYGSLQLEMAQPVLQLIYRATLNRLAADSAGEPAGVSPQPYLRRAILESVGYLFFGLSPGDGRLDELERCLPLLQGPAVGNRGWQEETREGLRRATAIIESLRASWREENGAGFRPALRGLTDHDPTVLGNFVLIAHIAYGDLTGLFRWIFKFLSDHPQELDPVRAGVSGAATRIVMETVRLEQSEFLYRRAIRGIAFQGLTIPAGWMIRCCIHESHRDPAVFEEPDRFLPGRFAGRAYSREEYAPFGADVHACMGGHIAHFLGSLFVEQLAAGFDWRIVADGPPERAGNRHRDHWHPSSLTRVAMAPRAPVSSRV